MSRRQHDLIPIPHDHRPLGPTQWNRPQHGHRLPLPESLASTGPRGPQPMYPHPSQYHAPPASLPHVVPHEPLPNDFVPQTAPQQQLAQHHNPYQTAELRNRQPMQHFPVPQNQYSRRGEPAIQSQQGHYNLQSSYPSQPPALPAYNQTATGASRQQGGNQVTRPMAQIMGQHSSSISTPSVAVAPRQDVAIAGKNAGIPNLLGPSRSHIVAQMNFTLKMRQQPQAARACGSGERDRRNIDPPPIVQLHIDGPGITREEVNRYLRYEGYVMSCGIYDESGTKDASQMPSEYRYQRRLTGSLVGTPFHGKDDADEEGCFFPFSDLSIRTLGRYRLKFTLTMLNISNLVQNARFPILAETLSDALDVYTAKEFPGINQSSKLVRTLREQGCIIAIKKGNDKKKKARGPGNEDEGEEDDEEDNYAPYTDNNYNMGRG